jgi:hypothetical protein
MRRNVVALIVLFKVTQTHGEEVFARWGAPSFIKQVKPALADKKWDRNL